MKFLAAVTLPLLLALSRPALAQDSGPWRAADSTAKTITGDIEIANGRLLINFAGFPLAQIRALKPAEASGAFDADPSTPGGGNLYRLQVPADKRFQHHNTLCGGEQTQWMATWASGSELQVAFFSGQNMPVLTLDALNGSSAGCGVYRYVR
ncbi:MAG TPA: hypothetical protein VHX37_02160 [Acidobacteriaceae bacterium]|jgi:hypothetical protein|nr:hypothetical protein [Acidobacteriaceae bacterium]